MDIETLKAERKKQGKILGWLVVTPLFYLVIATLIFI